MMKTIMWVAPVVAILRSLLLYLAWNAVHPGLSFVQAFLLTCCFTGFYEK